MVVVLRNMKLTVIEAIQLLVMSIVELTTAGDIVTGDGYCGVDGCDNGVGSGENVVNLFAAVMDEQSEE
ncbi:hypothetical protein KY290_010019 [Solanum tuberosum]|uniref:Uncharacterized protein n=1 Tax=Solanum tuberosum TaxID=4113 RepID=A0ABQ7VWK1_SOLTU|nr:hypothetical protein KY289_010403 [Solanum tuberosum]KAH0708546.1 hypothetical protein KY284_009973 [Solanum tuberosum]KAH0772882.1 hypothetical protein KY290_010019 [Solanum tuberosum]